MKSLDAVTRISLKNILFLTDFSDSSEAALPFALGIARGYGAAIHALHVMLPQPLSYATPEGLAAALDAQDEFARAEKKLLEAQLSGVPHAVQIVRAASVWEAAEQAARATAADLIVIGTHGRAGAPRLLLGSIAEEIFRRSAVPVLTIGPSAHEGLHGGGRFRSVLYATDFSPHSDAAAPFAISLAQENQARLILFHVIRESERQASASQMLSSTDLALRELKSIVPPEAGLWCHPESLVGYGDPAERILQVAAEHHADLIVLGIRDLPGHIAAATHLGRAIAHRVVSQAACPVLTIRG